MFLSKYYHRRWVESLKVGDWIENCNYCVEQITEAEIVYCQTKFGYHLYRFLSWWPWLQDKLDYIKFLHQFCDQDLVLTNGAPCSGMHCCDPPLEKWIDYE